MSRVLFPGVTPLACHCALADVTQQIVSPPQVKEAVAQVRERRPELLVEGPIQYDAAVDPAIAAVKIKVGGFGSRFHICAAHLSSVCAGMDCHLSSLRMHWKSRIHTAAGAMLSMAVAAWNPRSCQTAGVNALTCADMMLCAGQQRGRRQSQRPHLPRCCAAHLQHVSIADSPRAYCCGFCASVSAAM